MRRSVPSWQKGENSPSQAWLVQSRIHMHQMMKSIHQAHHEMHQTLKMMYQAQHVGLIAEPIPPVNGQAHPRGFSSLRVIPVIMCESTGWLCFVAYRTVLPA